MAAVLMELHDITPDRRVPFSARLKHFQRLGLVPEINTGKGRAAIYGPAAFVHLALALEMAQIGIRPERTLNLLKWAGNLILTAIRLTLHPSDIPEDERNDFLIYFQPTALDPTPLGDGQEDQVVQSFFYGPTSTLGTRLAESKGEFAFQRLAIINVSHIIGLAYGTALRLKLPDAENFPNHIYEWACEREEMIDGDDPEA